MKAVLCHNYYQLPGGEDQVFDDETWLLESHGHEVVRYIRHNDDVDRQSKWATVKQTFWSQRTYDEIRALLAREKPDVIHFTNTFPLISPSAYDAANDEGVPVVQSIHNFRLICPGSNLLRDEQVCEDCIGKRFAWPSALHGCYRGSKLGTGVIAAMIAWHHHKGTWANKVHRYIALTEFCKDKLIEGGLPRERMAVKVNFVHPRPQPCDKPGDYVVFVGRLSKEKGIRVLLDAWERMDQEIPLKILGKGPQSDLVERAAASNDMIEYLGHQSRENTDRLIREARCLVISSIYYESCPKTILESVAAGTPVVASGLGAIAELVEDGRSGLHFESGDPSDLATKVAQVYNDPALRQRLHEGALDSFDRRFTAEANYERLMTIYEEAKAESGK